ncbi:outer membrane lipid asymmetry maintenance protein MlaD [Chitiniphilus purpureus]|uniref:Outer membrane lipid asymmetry maintenance protein MlaD n=1 Tax=Chitiniphilus purpureus TaxID=2981137 RepID=A0ABY6DLM8_9NEIS|nr:outer membrane lipid asymmetry maintenance protein MlaD [Chitiniphilus sp. CD1]UXY15244.1 outer membrane lipid asymmetry maintenance protein MlaD [Chitiniphilus sp. CD1]
MQRRMIDLWVGLFALAGAAALLFLALKVSNDSVLPASSTYEVTAEFENIGGLKPRAPVKSAGVVVGRVTQIELDPKLYVARVTLALDSRYRFSRDSSAQILTSGLLGEQYIGLEPGADDKELDAGGRIAITSSAIVLEQLISRFLFSKAETAGEQTNTEQSQ